MTVRLGPPPKASSPQVSAVMKANRARGTEPERILQRALRQVGLRRFSTSPRLIPGRPDVTFMRQRLAVFVHGCFWHHCPRCSLRLPKVNTGFWRRKFTLNRARDRRKAANLRRTGWAVMTVWECQVRSGAQRVAVRIAVRLARCTAGAAMPGVSVGRALRLSSK